MNAEEIKERIERQLSASRVQVVDDSDKHRGHVGQRSGGGGHYQVFVVSDIFKNCNLIKRHRIVFDLFKEEMGSSIHALSIKAMTPDEVSA